MESYQTWIITFNRILNYVIYEKHFLSRHGALYLQTTSPSLYPIVICRKFLFLRAGANAITRWLQSVTSPHLARDKRWRRRRRRRRRVATGPVPINASLGRSFRYFSTQTRVTWVAIERKRWERPVLANRTYNVIPVSVLFSTRTGNFRVKFEFHRAFLRACVEKIGEVFPRTRVCYSLFINELWIYTASTGWEKKKDFRALERELSVSHISVVSLWQRLDGAETPVDRKSV